MHIFRLKIFWTIFLSIVLMGCGVIKTGIASLSYNDVSNDMGDHNLAEDKFTTELAKRFGLMALFAEVSYRRGTNSEMSCNSADTEVVPYIEATTGSKWMRWKAPEGVNACLDKQGLFYETYVYGENGIYSEAVIAFRGTEGMADLRDWQANLAALFAFEPTEYKLARENILSLIAALKTGKNEEIKIYAVGHSLGGGLAQQAGYLSKDINEVITFNSSPVTNWSTLRLKGLVGNRYPTIYRIHHNGEILEKVRFVTTSFTNARYGRYDIGIQLGRKSNLEGHSMAIFACTFAELIGYSNNGGSHHYSSYAAKEIVKSDICKKDDKEYMKIIKAS